MRMIRSLLAAAALAAAVAVTGLPAALADTDNASPGRDVVLVPVQLSGEYTTTTADVATIKLPFSAQVLGVSATARASGGTTPTLTVDVLEGGTSILSSAVAVTAGAVAEASVSDAVIADEALVSIDLTIGGGSPTWDDITVLLTLIRR